MKLPEMPSLPEDGKVTIGLSGGSGPGLSVCNAFTADQMRSYAIQCMEMVREECARVCDEQIAVYDAKIVQALNAGREAQQDRLECYKDAVENIAAAIREKTP